LYTNVVSVYHNELRQTSSHMRPDDVGLLKHTCWPAPKFGAGQLFRPKIAGPSQSTANETLYRACRTPEQKSSLESDYPIGESGKTARSGRAKIGQPDFGAGQMFSEKIA